MGLRCWLGPGFFGFVWGFSLILGVRYNRAESKEEGGYTNVDV